MCAHGAAMSAHESWALISYFSADACHQHSYQKYIPDHNHRTSGCQNTSRAHEHKWKTREREVCGGRQEKMAQRDDTGWIRAESSCWIGLPCEISTDVFIVLQYTYFTALLPFLRRPAEILFVDVEGPYSFHVHGMNACMSSYKVCVSVWGVLVQNISSH